MKKILITIPMEEKHKEKIKNIAFDGKIKYCSASEIIKEDVCQAEIILGNVPAEFLKESKNLKWIQLNSAGANAYIEKGVLKEGVILTNATGAYGLAISEHMLAMVLALQKKICLYTENQKNHLWKDEGEVKSIYGSKTLVVGLGDIGGEFAKRMYFLGSKVYGIKKHKTELPFYIEKMYQMEELEEILPEFDIVAVSLPETKETINLFNKSKFDKMKKGALFLNVGRGSIVNSLDLCEALNSGKLGGAGIDVADIEPLPKENPLWEAANILITPHISGGYHLKETLERVRNTAIENLKSYYENKPMKNLVDFQTGYKKFNK
ncbi:D-2-hydroxyacid dehydrogenase [Fusobacterium sp. SB021]|uniref:D-2-hydroxyacid dehydrogenase n=1 Tax=Fusobacterium sp. SB021 TaxID=2744227 RepID=UPI003CF73CF4